MQLQDKHTGTPDKAADVWSLRQENRAVWSAVLGLNNGRG
jgi:hypothetical protein